MNKNELKKLIAEAYLEVANEAKKEADKKIYEDGEDTQDDLGELKSLVPCC